MFTELKYVLEGMVTPLKELLTRTTHALQTPAAQDAATVAPLLQCVRLVCRVFYSLNAQVRRPPSPARCRRTQCT